FCGCLARRRLALCRAGNRVGDLVVEHRCSCGGGGLGFGVRRFFFGLAPPREQAGAQQQGADGSEAEKPSAATLNRHERVNTCQSMGHDLTFCTSRFRSACLRKRSSFESAVGGSRKPPLEGWAQPQKSLGSVVTRAPHLHLYSAV